MDNTVFGKIVRMVRRLMASHYFGFVCGHSLSSDQVSVVADALKTEENDEIILGYEQELASLIGSGYGKSFLAGRMAFYSLLKILNIGPGDEVILPAFTCSVMPNAVWRVGAIPIFADIDPDTFGSNAVDIEKKITPRTRMIVAQHSFGIPCRMQEILEVAKRRGIFLLEDAAISFDSERKGIKIGNWGDAALFSTDHTKPLNTIVGGYLYTRDRILFEKIQAFSKDLPSLGLQHQRRLYRQFLFERTWCVPRWYGRSVLMVKVRNFIHKICGEGSVFLESDYLPKVPAMHDYPYPAKMPAFLAQLGMFELDRWEQEKRVRQGLLKEYLQIMDEYGLNEFIPAAYKDTQNQIVPLRFAFSFPLAEKMKKFLEPFLEIQHIWFQAPVICCPQGPESMGYQYGSCPRAEQISTTIINWPCVVVEDARKELIFLLRNVCKELAGHAKR